jgi:hypothetical protein
MNDMPLGEASEIAGLEAELLANPDSLELRERLLEAYGADPNLVGHPGRTANIRWFIDHDPGNHYARTPFMAVSPDAGAAFEEIKAAWLARLEAPPLDACIMRGAASLIACHDIEAAVTILERAAALEPSNAEILIQIGLTSGAPTKQYLCFAKARELGSEHPNLVVWLSRAAAHSGHLDEPDLAARELLGWVEALDTTLGVAVTWRESGRELWLRARHACSSDTDARAMTTSLANRAYWKHWAHTILGVLACQREDLDQAEMHLRASADVQVDFRLAAYGPAPDLIRGLCTRHRWDEAALFLRDWVSKSEHPHARAWLGQIELRVVPGDAKTG